MRIGETQSKQMVIMDFTGVYGRETFYRAHDFIWLDLKEVQGTNGYCDKEAEEELRNRIRRLGPEGLHFLDSGNYHYASKLWLDMVEEDFELLVFDHHTDMQEPVFGKILSCGGWLKVALDTNARLKRVWLIGPAAEGIKEAKALGFGDRVICICEEDMGGVERCQERLGQSSLPLYISVDKDILSREDARTNWDQGTVRLDAVLDIIRAAAKKRRIIGMDVCGENPEEREQEEVVSRNVNDRTNRALIAVFLELCAGKGQALWQGEQARR